MHHRPSHMTNEIEEQVMGICVNFIELSLWDNKFEVDEYLSSALYRDKVKERFLGPDKRMRLGREISSIPEALEEKFDYGPRLPELSAGASPFSSGTSQDNSQK